MKPLSASLPGIMRIVAPVTKAQITAIQTLRRKAGLTEADYRAMLMAVGGVASTTKLSMADAETLRAKLQALAPSMDAGPKAGKRSARDTMSGLYAGVLRALWLSAYNLGIVENRDDRALIAFVERQTRLTHPGFLHAAADATKAIEALKAMISREAGLHWPRRSDVTATKLAIIEAQLHLVDRLAPGTIPGGIEGEMARLRGADITNAIIDGQQEWLGTVIRVAKAKARA